MQNTKCFTLSRKPGKRYNKNQEILRKLSVLGARRSNSMKNFVDDMKLEAFDILAYLFPGSIILGALAIFNFDFFSHRLFFYFIHNSTIAWILLLFLAYILGYIIQGVGEFIVKFFENKVEEKNCLFECSLPRKVSSEFENLAICKSEQALGYPGIINEDNIYNICVAFIEQRGSSKSRKMLQSMQGMSLSLSVSFFISTFLLILRCQLIIAILLLFFSTVAFYRYKLFDRYRQQDAILSFLALDINQDRENG